MKQLFRIGFIFTIIMVLALGVFIIFNSENHFEERDIVHYNEQLHIIEDALENGGIVIALGVSRYDHDDKVAAVYERADQIMYENKRLGKQTKQ